MTARIYLRITLIMILTIVQQSFCSEDGYLRYVKDGCFKNGEALSCVKYKALKIATKTIFGDNSSNETIKANQMISFVPLDERTIEKLSSNDKKDTFVTKPRSFISEWAELAKYLMKLVKDFFKVKGLKVNLPEGARTIEEEEDNGDSGDIPDSGRVKARPRPTRIPKIGRGRRKKLAIVIPLLTLLAALKIKFLLIPILLAVMLIKKLLLAAAFLLPSLLNTLKACKHHHPTHYSYFGSSDSSDFSSDYGNSYSYGSSGNYGASNRAYSIPKHRPTPSPVYITAPGTA